MRGMFAASALFLVASPALAGDEEQALAAIAQAQGKIDAATKLKSGTASPELLAKAQASLRLAQEELKSGKEQKAIKDAIAAQQFADTAIGESQQRAEVDAQVQASTVAGAQQDAAAANARASVAEQAAASAAADAQAARNAAAVAATTPAVTTVTTETVKTAAPVTVSKAPARKRKVVRKTRSAPARAALTEKTTTTVTHQ
ncbi:hypothetical protein WG907_01155 [Sphingobium sp. AN558]|uniref:hypothetical protein n=1 Tax=Sphingobium sp. AN558 TaxID=3133442 RepID=UPI0030C104DD